LRLFALVAVVVIVSLIGANRAAAGPVQFQDGAIVVDFIVSGEERDSATFPITFPGSAAEEFGGTSPIGGTRGSGGATYDLQDLADGAQFDVEIFHDNDGDASRTVGGEVDFGFNFTTDRILHYRFTAAPEFANEFTASFAGVTQNLLTDVFGNMSGSLLEDGLVVAKTVEGTLPAGEQNLSVFLRVVNGRSSSGSSGRGAVSITLSDEASKPPIIPLPPAMWLGLASLAVAGVASRLKMIRRLI
jgi:hypothetical protein